MSKPKTKPEDGKHDTHIYMDDLLWSQLVKAANEDARSITGMCRILVMEGLAMRKPAPKRRGK